jgi:hypothetical protein
MKLKTVLKEHAMLTYRDLESLQKYMLVRLDSGNLDYDNISAKDWATINGLQDLSLVDDSLELTPIGKRAAELGKKYGTFDTKRAGERDRKLGRTGGPATRYTDDENAGDEVDPNSADAAPFRDRWEDVSHAD